MTKENKQNDPKKPAVCHHGDCAILYKDERMEYELRIGTCIVKWSYISSSDLAAEIIAPECLAGTRLRASHIPYFAMHTGDWYYKDWEITQKAYDWLKRSIVGP
jgi:hypothetical protein